MTRAFGLASLMVTFLSCTQLNTWQHFALVFDRGTIQYYKNGRPLGNPLNGGPDLPDSGDLIIGNFQANLDINRIFNGLMDDIGIWARPLTPSDIDGIYQNGLLGRTLTTPFEPLTIRRLEIGDEDTSLDLIFFTPYLNREYEIQRRENIQEGTWTTQEGVDFIEMDAEHVSASFSAPPEGTAFYRVVALAPPPFFADDFESGALGWTHGGFEDNWALGTPTTGPGSARSGVNVYATGLDSNYGAFADAFLRSPIIDLNGVTRATLSFWEWRSVDPDPTFHGTVVTVLDADTLLPLQELARTAGATTGWQLRTLPLGAASLNRRIVLEFRLYSDQFELREGWYLDDVTLSSE